MITCIQITARRQRDCFRFLKDVRSLSYATADHILPVWEGSVALRNCSNPFARNTQKGTV